MKVIDMNDFVLKNFVDGCRQAVREENISGTFMDGRNRGIEDALKLVGDEKDLTFVIRMAISGLKFKYDFGMDSPPQYDPSPGTYRTGYDEGIGETIRILTGKIIER